LNGESLQELYSQLEREFHRRGREGIIDSIFHRILKKSFQIVNQKWEKGEKFGPFLVGKMGEEEWEEVMAIRGMYEYLLELWANREWEEAREVGLDMAFLSADKRLRQMFSLMVLPILAKVPIEQFLENYLDRSNEPYLGYFFTEFTGKIDPLVQKYGKQFKQRFGKVGRARE